MSSENPGFSEQGPAPADEKTRRIEVPLPKLLELPKELTEDKTARRILMWVIAGITLAVAAGSIPMSGTTPNQKLWIVLGIVALLTSIGGVHTFFGAREDRTRQKESYLERLKEDLAKRKQQTDGLDRSIADLREKLAASEQRAAGALHKADNPPLELVDKQAYGRCLQEWNDSGRGELLLYNIELQSFESSATIAKAWGRLASWTNMDRIKLLLSPERVRRWEQVVKREANQFFAAPEHRRFDVAELRSQDDDSAPLGIGFALYRLHPTAAGPGRLHPRALVFVLSEPFSQHKQYYGPVSAKWWDYRLILEAEGHADILGSCDQVWQEYFPDGAERDVEQVLADVTTPEPLPLEDFLEALQVPLARRAEVLDQLKPRVLKKSPDKLQPGRPPGRLSIEYQNSRYENDQPWEHVIDVRYSGLPEPGVLRPAIVWVGGFTERTNTDLSRFFERQLRSEDLIQIHYQVSHRIEHVNVSGCMQDLEQVLDWVRRQDHVIERGRVVLCARSINALAAALVAAKPVYSDVLAGVILASPVFDILQTIRGYRAARGHADFGVEQVWRRKSSYTLADLEELGYLEFFNRTVSLALFGDIVRHPHDRFTLESFLDGVSIIAEKCPVAILSNADDPVTGSALARRRLDARASGGGHLSRDNYVFIETASSHLPPNVITKDRYPFVIKDESEQVRRSLRDMLTRSGLPVTAEPPSRPAQDGERGPEGAAV